jgi:DNA polymerase III gamma/tau subunit
MIETHEKLYLYGKYINFFKNLYFNKKLPSSIMVVGKNGIGKKNFIAHLLLNIQKNISLTAQQINNTDFIFHNKNDLNNIINNKQSNIKFIYNLENSSNITIDQIREIANYTKQSSLNGDSKFIVICNPENLNIFAANSLLKILENPPENNYFILISDSEKSLLNTVKSRCVKFNIFLDI